MIRIPYGISDYRTMVREGYFYEDRTAYLQTLEKWDSPYLIYLRPRRFGKSLWLSVLRYYYGMQHKNEFEKLFGHTYIGKNKTKLANTYMVLSFDFSGINTASEQGVLEGFLSSIQKGLMNFFDDYSSHISIEQQKTILNQKEASDALRLLFGYLYSTRIESQIYIVIDEYDHFSNELIAFNFDHFNTIISRNGYVRKFYETIKIGTGQGIVGRMFITGVAPITIDSLTSGFNIAKNISLNPTFHQLTGFDEKEVSNILAGVEMTTADIPETVKDLRLWYNGYSFSQKIKEKVYNPNMVLYFAHEYKEVKMYPRTMLDVNIASDYSKIQKLFNIQGKSENFLLVLTELLENGEVVSSLTEQYNFERGFTRDDLVSLLFYMGFLTIKSENLSRFTFGFPNYVIKKLYADYFFNSILGKAQLPFDNTPVNNAIVEMATNGNPTAFFEQVKLVLKYFSTRDKAHFNENSLKAIIISLLHQQNFFFIHSEYETEWTYMDVFLEAIRGQKPNFEVAMELKYAPKGGKMATATLFKQAAEQLQMYLNTPKFNTRTHIKAFVVVVVGYKLEWRLL